MNEQPSIPTLRPEWHAASWFGGTLGSVLWIGIYAVVILSETGSLLYGGLCLAAGLTVTGFAWYLWTRQESVTYGVAMQVAMGMAGLAGLAGRRSRTAKHGVGLARRTARTACDTLALRHARPDSSSGRT